MLGLITDDSTTLFFIVLLTTMMAISGSPSAAQTSVGRITGVVIDSETAEPIVGASIALVERSGGTISDSTGSFTLRRLEPASYRLQVSHVGYETTTTDEIIVQAGSDTLLSIQMVKKPVSIKGVIVTPGQYTIMGREPTTRQLLPREVIETRPQLADDLFRAVQRLPGITYNDFSAKFNIRGGEQDEVLINIDGMEIYEPFHLKDIDGGVISTTDVAAIEGVDLLAGGYPADYGDRMSGVFNINTKNPAADHNRMSLGISLMNARFLTEGTFAGNKGAWLLSGRRGYLDLLLDIVGQSDNIRPRYYDLFGKVRYQLTDRYMLTASFLRADDDLDYLGERGDEENNEGDTLRSSYGNTYFWLTLDSYLTARLVGKTIASLGRVRHEREGQIFDEYRGVVEMRARDHRRSNLVGIKTDWEYEATDDILFKIGFDFRNVSADYDYSGYAYDYIYSPGSFPPYLLDGIEAREITTDPSGDKISAYLSNRVRFTSALIGELGLRYDRTTYCSDEKWAPRANLSYTFSEVTSLKLGWGHFYQIERIDEINVQDGETEFHPFERAEHFVAGLEHTAGSGENFRLNVFYKKYSDLSPAFRNTFGELVTFPELEEDRVKIKFNGKTAKGAELSVKKDVGDKVSWWLNYSVSEVEDDIKSLFFYNEGVLVNYNEKFPFPYDQLHTLYFDLNYRFNEKWRLNLAWQLHTGWPYTEVYMKRISQGGQTNVFLEAGEPWRARHEHFKRLDIRLNRKFKTSRGTITAFVEVINVLGQENVRNFEYVLVYTGGVYSIEMVKERWFGTMPSFGISYDFTF